MNTLRLLILGLALGFALLDAGCVASPKRGISSASAVQVIEEPDYWALLPQEREPGMPVLYFLHGRGNSQRMFQDLGGVEHYLRYLEDGGKPFAVVAFRGGDAERSYYWVDEVGAGGRPWATYLMRDLLPKIEARYGIGGARERRMIAGISMGSAGSYQLAMNFPGLFRCVAGHSLVVRDAKSAVADFPISFGSEKIYSERFDPIELAKKYRLRGERPFDMAWIDIGGKDDAGWVARARQMAEELATAGYPVARFDVGGKFPEGGHSYEYWKERMPEYLGWYSECLTGR